MISNLRFGGIYHLNVRPEERKDIKPVLDTLEAQAKAQNLPLFVQEIFNHEGGTAYYTVYTTPADAKRGKLIVETIARGEQERKAVQLQVQQEGKTLQEELDIIKRTLIEQYFAPNGVPLTDPQDRYNAFELVSTDLKKATSQCERTTEFQRSRHTQANEDQHASTLKLYNYPGFQNSPELDISHVKALLAQDRFDIETGRAKSKLEWLVRLLSRRKA
jgi:hypothetical protein